MAMPINEPLLESKLTQLEEARSWSSRVISKLETTIRTADDFALFRLNPLAYAAKKNLSESEAIDLFLYATRFGIFEMDWHLVCPYCAHVVESFKELSSVHSHFVCNLCRAEHDASLDDYICITFTISPQIRDIVYHHPDALPERVPIEDFYGKYHISQDVRPMPNGMSYFDWILMFTKSRQYVQSHARASITFDVGHGMLHAVDLNNNAGVSFLVQPNEHSAPQALPLRLSNGKFRVAEATLPPGDFTVGQEVFKFEQFGELESGCVQAEVVNDSERVCSFWLIHFPMEPGPQHQQFAPFLSGKRLLSTQTFLSLFRSMTTPSGEGLAVADLTYVFTGLKGSTALYDAIGDPKAFYLVRQHFDTISNAVIRNNGAIVKTIGDAVMATFLSPTDAVRAAVDMLGGIDEFNRAISEKLVLKIGIHKGHAIAVTLNDRLDYFGQSVNIANRIQNLADANEIFISEDVYNSSGVREAVASYELTPQQTIMKGVSGEMQVYKVTARG